MKDIINVFEKNFKSLETRTGATPVFKEPKHLSHSIMEQCLQNVMNGLACSSLYFRLMKLINNKSITRTLQSTLHGFDTLPKTILKLKGSSVANPNKLNVCN